jgi:hypothetical protein
MLLRNGCSGILVLFLMDFLLEDTALFGGSLAANQSSITVKVASNFLQRSILGLNVEEVDENDLESQPGALNLEISKCMHEV